MDGGYNQVILYPSSGWFRWVEMLEGVTTRQLQVSLSALTVRSGHIQRRW